MSNITPPSITTTAALEDALSAPDDGVVAALQECDGDLILLGAGGKMGPTLARMARRAFDAAGSDRRVIAVSRFSKAEARASLEACGVETVSCDLLDPAQVAALPDAPNVVYMTGMKFGATGNVGRTWAMNTYAPALAFARYRGSRIAAFSSGNVYGMAPADSDGSRETDPLQPDGEYSMSCLGRERIFEHFSREHGTPTSIIRLNYACELRYGVLVDIANWVWTGQPVPLAMGYLNAIWQRDANAITLRSLLHAASPPFVLNVAGPEKLRVREVATRLGELMQREVHFEGEEADTAYLSDAAQMCRDFGPPQTSTDQLIEWIADWVKHDREQHGLPTHFEVTTGKY